MPDAPQAPSTDDPFLQGVFQSPIIKQLQSGDVPPIYVTAADFGPHADLLPKLQQGLPQLGLGVVTAPKSGALVAFNKNLYTAKDILEADAAGKLSTIALPLQTQYSQAAAGGAAPAPDASGAASAPQASPAPSPTPAAAPATPPAAPTPSITAGLMGNPATNPAQKARLSAMAPQPPTRQAKPSSGILNGLMSRAS